MSHKILTVDDSKTIRMIVGKAFKAYDCQVFEAENGVEGLSAAGREKPDLIILDYTMPVMDGSEMLTRLRSDPALKATPVIMLTAEAGRDTVMKIAKLGVRDYLVKPFKEDLLVERVRRVVNVGLKAEAAKPPKRYDDEIRILVCDDKPAIVEQVRRGLADTPWKVVDVAEASKALEMVIVGGVDAVMVSLSLKDNSAFTFFQSVHANPKYASIPIFGLSVRTAVAEHTQAQQAGFAGLVSKPIDAHDMKTKIAKALKLEIAYKYFKQVDATLQISLPGNADTALLHQLAKSLNEELVNAVECGLEKVLIDLGDTPKATMPILEFMVSAIRGSTELSLVPSVVAQQPFREDCRSYEETQSWNWVDTAVLAA